MEQNQNMRPTPSKEPGTANENWRSGEQELSKKNSNYSNEEMGTDEDSDPPLTEQDLEENNLTDEEADNI